MNTNPKPLLLIDVDGVINPWRKVTRKGHRAGEGFHRVDIIGLPSHPKGLPVLFSPEHGTALQTLSKDYSLVWATTWMDEANRLISPLLGLPDDLPVIYFPEHALKSFWRDGRNGSWKTKWIAQWLAEHAPAAPWAWVDDEVNRFDRKWFTNWYETRTPVPHLLLRVDGHHALTGEHFEALHEFALTASARTN